MEAAWRTRERERAAERAAGARTFWAARNHPLVLVEMRRTRKWRRGATATCVAAPALAFAAALMLRLAPAAGDLGAQLALAFAALWPAGMFAGAALRAAGAVVSERTADTAMQIVLTPLPKRAIGAAKILPSLPPFLWGIVAALPVYTLAGLLTGPQLLAGSWLPAGLVAWPYRLLLVLSQSGGEAWLIGGLAGPVMCLTDLGLVWIGAHAGAALAVRHASLPRTVLHLVGRLLATAMGLLACFMGAGVLATFLILAAADRVPAGAENAVAVVVMVGALGTFLYFWWQETLRNAARLALEEFGWFDRLAMDEPAPPRHGLGANWEWLDGPTRP